MKRQAESDKTFLFAALALVAFGFTMFVSASLGILATASTAVFDATVFKQAFFGVVLGLVACFVFSRVTYGFFKKHAFVILVGSLVLTLAVFIPHIGLRLNGARRWIDVAGLSFQPVALLNFAFVAYWAAWLSFVKDKVSTFKFGILPLVILLGIIGIILLAQPDTDSFIILAAAGVAMLLIAGGRLKHILFLCLAGVAMLGVLALVRPYVMARIMTYFNPGDNALTSGYQVGQAEIAIGSGQFFGRGLGQSVQKYKFLPEATNDSIFAVLGEELGFVGAAFAIGLFVFFVFRGLRIATRAPDSFSGLLVAGIVIIIAVQSFVNIGATLGVIPFSGIPLVFFSQGGTALLVALAEVGVILNVSSYSKL